MVRHDSISILIPSDTIMPIPQKKKGCLFILDIDILRVATMHRIVTHRIVTHRTDISIHSDESLHPYLAHMWFCLQFLVHL